MTVKSALLITLVTSLLFHHLLPVLQEMGVSVLRDIPQSRRLEDYPGSEAAIPHRSTPLLGGFSNHWKIV
jgi:hypothetical protein